ncbi:glycosyltransferase family 2 protein [Hymenobacter volaticus]|uniref:Glycosyltransferase n=1 Tax=Hymenobacter volaticus TaxID=2932254 RepID=A0ABY4G676_9BACT|nr:glycosyltransferase family 2 protein [Hymenobacter volaticus]UOQ66415.1 glycosyltransferase [Hymenobacter volaticus]
MKVSVCIPTYNQSQYLALAVRSAFNQTVAPSEIIILDDCSTDNTAEILKELEKEIPVLKNFRQPKNVGISKNTDECLRKATGEFIVRLDSDDILAPSYIEKLSALLVRHPEAAYAHGAIQEIDEHGNFLRQRLLIRQSGFQKSEDALLASKKGYRVAANIIMFRRAALEAVNYNTGRPNSAEDFHLSAALAAAGFGNIYLDEILAFYRVWSDAGKVRQRRKMLEIDGVRKVFEEVLEPAYKKRGWNITQLYKERANFAGVLSDCLGSDVYTAQEKSELAEALNLLSSSKRAQMFAWAHMNGFGSILSSYSDLMTALKATFKKYRRGLRQSDIPNPI